MKCHVNGEVKEAEEELKAFISPSKVEPSVEANKYSSSDDNSTEKAPLDATDKSRVNENDDDKNSLHTQSDETVNSSSTQLSNNNN